MLSDERLIDLIPSRLDALVAALDRRIGAQLDEILHHPSFQALERTWRGLRFVVDRADFRENVRIELWPCSKAELMADLEDHHWAESALHGVVYTAVYHAAGRSSAREGDATPYGAIIAGFEIGGEPADLALLRGAALIGLHTLCPFIAGAAPSLLGLESFAELPADLGLSRHRALLVTRLARWNTLRSSQEARAAGLTLPRFELRAPHVLTEPFCYSERAMPSDRCWGVASFALATRLTDSFARHRWCPNIIGKEDGLVADLGAAAVEATIAEGCAVELDGLGLIPLLSGDGGARFESAASLHAARPAADSDSKARAAVNDSLGAQLPYFFILTRVMQYLKVVYRNSDGLGSPEEAEKELSDWLNQYVADRDVVSSAVRSRRMLRKAQVVVTNPEDAAEWYKLEVTLRPHFKHLGAFFSLRLAAKLDKP